jgi:protein-disulfide isomerase
MKFRLFRVVLMVSILWMASCSSSPQQEADQVPVAQTADKAGTEEQENPNEAESDILPVGDSPVLGKADAPVTIVAFSDLQCPFCARGATTMHRLVEKYPNDVRVVFKHYPLPFHQQADEAAKATIAAGNQGKFWEMHDWLFENQRQFKVHQNGFKEWTAQRAKEMGLDVEQFEADFDAPATQKQIDDDMKLGQDVAVRGTPHFFVNGERVRGAKPLADFEAVVKRKLKQANEMLSKDGVSREALYKKVVAENYAKPEPPKPRRRKMQTNVEYVPVSQDDPMFGNTKDPLVTIVEFSDFQCPFCAKVTPTLDQISKEYGDQVRVVFKQLPLAMHAQAKPAARAALAAHEQGAFWEMHDKLFEKQREMRANADNFDAWAVDVAQEIGLDVAKFEKDYNSDAIAQKVEDDLKLSLKVGARGTPNFWINGVNLRGAQPFSAFKAEIDKQIKIAEQLRDDKGLEGEALYKAAVAKNKADNPQEKDEPSVRKKPDPKVDTSKLVVGQAPTLGPKDAPVTIFVFSDFQCPYCKRGIQNAEEAMKKHQDEVRLVYKHYPLPFHKEAKPAAKAAMAAGEQGKFWEMHDKLFEKQREMRKHSADFDAWVAGLAKEMGLDVAQFKEDMKKPEYDKIIEADMKMGQEVGVRGTPVFFVNGVRVVGAQPTSKFDSTIKEELDEAK